MTVSNRWCRWAVIACAMAIGAPAAAAAQLAAGGAGTARSSPIVRPAPAARQARPNVLILFFDDLRFDSFSYRGGPVPTPHIDALAAQSTRFDMAITTTGLCSPSRAALFTGRWGHRTGLDDNVELWHSRLIRLDAREGGLIRRAANAGYYVGYVGKWHLGANGPQQRGAEFIGAFEADAHEAERPFTPVAGLANIRRYQAGERDANGEKHEYYQTLPGGYESSPTASKVLEARKFLRQAAAGKRPFFGVVSFQQPHPPYRVPEPYASMFDPAKIVMPSNHLAPRAGKPLSQEYPYWPWHDVSHMTDMDWRKARAHYYGAVAMIDRAVGEIIAAAKAEGVYDDLHIVFLGDQGSMLGEHGLYDKAAYAYDELMRIPLLMRDPGLKPRTVTHHVSLLDIPATLAEWMRLPPDGAVDGQSLAPLMKAGDTAATGRANEAIYAYEWYNGAWFGLRAIRTRDWKYVWNPGDVQDELYDLKRDPGEVTNRVGDPALNPTLRNLRVRLHARLVATQDPSAPRLGALLKRRGQ